MSLFRSLGARKDATRGTTALEVRKGLEGLFTGPGVLPGAASPLVQGTASFAYQVNAAHFVTRRATGDGLHLFGNDGAITVTTAVAPGSGLSRIDIIWVRHPSNGENGDLNSVPSLGVTEGTPASIPVPPSIPTGALEIARNTMTSAATSTSSVGNTIAQTAPRAHLRGSEPTTRLATFQRPVGTGTDIYTSPAFAPLVSGTWSDAPAGEYIVHSTLLIQGSSNLGGNLKVDAGGATISGANHRADVTAVATTITNAHPLTWPGGDLTVVVSHAVSSGSATVYNASTKAILQYLGAA